LNPSTNTKKTIDIDPNIFLIPPPEALLAKSAFVPEDAVTGGDVSFLKLQRLIGKERIERLNAAQRMIA
jgi:hypothetical protein